MNIDNPIIQSKIQEILLIVNKLPLDNKEARAKFALKLIDQVFTTNPLDAYDDKKEDEADEGDEGGEEKNNLYDRINNVSINFIDNDGNEAVNEDR